MALLDVYLNLPVYSLKTYMESGVTFFWRYSWFRRRVSCTIVITEKITSGNFPPPPPLEECQQEAKLGNWQLDLVINCYYWSRERFIVFFNVILILLYLIMTLLMTLFIQMIVSEFLELKDETINSMNMSYSIIYRIVLSEGDVKYLREHCHIASRYKWCGDIN